MNEQDYEVYKAISPKQPEPQNAPEGKGKEYKKGVIVGVVSTLVCVLALVAGMVVSGKLMAVGKTVGTASGSGEETADIKGLLDGETTLKMSRIEALLDEYYLFDQDTDAMQEGILKGMVESLGDPYTVYYNEEETTSLNESLNGQYYGIGAVLSQNRDTMLITVTQVYKNAPANEAGVKAGDILYKVDGEDITGQDVSEVVTKIRGDEGTQVTLVVMRDGNEVEISVTRRKVDVETVEYEMLQGQIGYIKITGFEFVTIDQFKKALSDLQKQGMKAVVMDVRDNPGGLLDICCEMLDEMLPEGLLVYTENKNGEVKNYESTGSDQIDIPVVVLVNENSASAAEIFTGALRDRIGATVIGTTTYGKGIVQWPLDLGDGTSLKITISEYFTPNGTKIHKVGITPDYEVEEVDNEEDKNSEDVDAPLAKALEVLGADQ